MGRTKAQPAMATLRGIHLPSNVVEELHKLKKFNPTKGRTESLSDVVERLVHEENQRQAST